MSGDAPALDVTAGASPTRRRGRAGIAARRGRRRARAAGPTAPAVLIGEPLAERARADALALDAALRAGAVRRPAARRRDARRQGQHRRRRLPDDRRLPGVRLRAGGRRRRSSPPARPPAPSSSARPTSTSSPPASSASARPTASPRTPTGRTWSPAGRARGSAVAVAAGAGRPRPRHRHRRVGPGAGGVQRHRRPQADAAAGSAPRGVVPGVRSLDCVSVFARSAGRRGARTRGPGGAGCRRRLLLRTAGSFAPCAGRPGSACRRPGRRRSASRQGCLAGSERLWTGWRASAARSSRSTSGRCWSWATSCTAGPWWPSARPPSVPPSPARPRGSTQWWRRSSAAAPASRRSTPTGPSTDWPSCAGGRPRSGTT